MELRRIGPHASINNPAADVAYRAESGVRRWTEIGAVEPTAKEDRERKERKERKENSTTDFTDTTDWFSIMRHMKAVAFECLDDAAEIVRAADEVGFPIRQIQLASQP